jgi:hypothetical protein
MELNTNEAQAQERLKDDHMWAVAAVGPATASRLAGDK